MASRTHRTLRAVSAEAVGIATAGLAGGSALWSISRFGEVDVPVFLWFLAPGALGIATPFFVRGRKVSQFDTGHWMKLVAGTLLLGAAFFAVDFVIASSEGHYRTIIDAALHAGSPFGAPLTILVCPVGTSLALGGLLRHLALRSTSKKAGLEPS